MGRVNIQVLLRDSSYLVRFLPKNAKTGGSAICVHKDLLPDEAMVTQVVSCQGRDHIVSIRAGCRSLVVVDVHFEPELTLRNLRERLRLITFHWLRARGGKIQRLESDPH